MDPITLNAIERILAIAIGGLSIWLGYRLFLAVPEQRDSAGKFQLPWNISVGLARVGPGVFFAVFGAGVVGYSLHGSTHVSENTVSVDGSPSKVTVVEAKGAMPTTDDIGKTLAARRLNVGTEMEFLSTLGRILRSDLSDIDKRMVSDNTVALKLAVMHALWAEDWGDEAAFREWAERGAQDPVPKDSKEAAKFFRIGME
jgi:hypothetical protein